MAAKRPAGDVELLFPGLSGGVRNPSNANRDIKDVLDRLDAERFGWVTSHTFRKTVATRLDEAGLSARAIADHLGHAKPSMTMDIYMGRNVASAEAAKVLGKDGS
ncbi:tyrosine-type recombinase/integrase [Actinomadura sp. 1N219]|uniref:tyrosine-type recombinase/integrase n=1 Tax=Actinomadura sp. 1N219 TaxID=3375152 RepID=UPI0037916388